MVMSASGAIVIVTDVDLSIRMVSNPDMPPVSHTQDTGLYSELIGANLLDQVASSDRDEIRDICDNILAGEVSPAGARSYRKIITHPESDNGRWVVLLSPAVSQNGLVDGVVYARLSSDKMTSTIDHEVRSSKFYECLVENAADVVVFADKEGRIQFVNQRAQHYGASSTEKLVGKHFSQFVHPDDVDKCNEMLNRAFASMAPFSGFNVRVMSGNGSRRYIVANGSVISAGDDIGLLAICRDVTESVELQQSLLARNRALSSLNGIIVALSRYTSHEDALQVALEKILSALDIEIGAIMLRSSDGNMRVGAYSRSSVTTADHHISRVASVLSRMCSSLGEPVVIRNLATDERIDLQTRGLMTEIGIEAGIAVPLRCGGPVTAVLALALPTPADLSLEQMEFVNLAAGILGPAIENARLHMDLADRVHRLAMLERLAKSINAGRDVHTVLNACMHEIGDLIAYDSAVVALVEHNGEAEVFRFSNDGYSEPAERMHLTVQQLDRLAVMQEPVVAPDVGPLAPFHTWGFLAFDRGSAVCARLTYKGKGFGLLNVWANGTDRFGEREVEILEAAAEHLAIAVSNARLYEAERVKSLQLEALAKEAQHRIKNNLQMITGLLSMSEADGDGSNKAMSRCLRQIRSIATIHELLNLDNITGMLRLKEVLRRIGNGALLAMGRADVELIVSGGDRMLSADAATALGIIVNELVSNAVEHGLRDRQNGRVEIKIGTSSKHTNVQVMDNGRGLPPQFCIPQNTDTVSGLALVNSLAMYGLGGKLNMWSSGSGTHASIEF